MNLCAVSAALLAMGRGSSRPSVLTADLLNLRRWLLAKGPYDYVFNLSALKHVRSEKDPFSLMRMIVVNILNTIDTVAIARNMGAQQYFCVSTDKAANPVNMMGASKLIMEHFLMRESISQAVSMARFANVAFSDGSLLHGFNQRFANRQPFSAPSDVERYFITQEESGELCMMSGFFGENRDIFFPKLTEEFVPQSFSNIAKRYLSEMGFEPFICDSEDEARGRLEDLLAMQKWPCYFFESDTTGEKDLEEFFTEGEKLDLKRFSNIGVIKNQSSFDAARLDHFLDEINTLRSSRSWTKEDLLTLFFNLIPEFAHMETGKYLDGRM